MKILLYFQNRDFGERLLGYFNERKTEDQQEDLHFVLATEVSSARQLLEKGCRGIVGTEEELGSLEKDLESFVKENQTKKLVLTTLVPQKDSEMYLYQSAEDMYLQMIAYFRGKKIEKERQMVCFLAPESYVNQTELAIDFCKKRSEKVLFVSFAGFPSILPEHNEGETTASGLSRLMFEMSEKNFSNLLEECSFSYEGITVVQPFWHFKDLLDLEKEDVVQFLELLRREQKYATIVLEVTQIFDTMLEVLEMVDEIYVPLSDCSFDQIRFGVLKGYCRMEGKKELVEKLQPYYAGKSTRKENREQKQQDGMTDYEEI